MDGLDGAQALWAVLGGGLIGLAGALLLVVAGRVMAISGMVGSLLGGAEGQAAWSIAFIGGLVMAASVMGLWAAQPVPDSRAAWPVLAAGGLAVGLGARMAGVGLSGDALMGLARLSGRSVVAVVCMAVAAVTGALVAGLIPGLIPAEAGAA